MPTARTSGANPTAPGMFLNDFDAHAVVGWASIRAAGALGAKGGSLRSMRLYNANLALVVRDGTLDKATEGARGELKKRRGVVYICEDGPRDWAQRVELALDGTLLKTEVHGDNIPLFIRKLQGIGR
jgi:hypothetical protein